LYFGILCGIVFVMTNRERQTLWQRRDYELNPEKYLNAARKYRETHPRTHCRKGHELIGDNVAQYALANGTIRKRCKTCHRLRNRGHYQARTHCRFGHALVESNSYCYVSKQGHKVRECKQCATAKNHRRVQQLRENHLKRNFHITQARFDELLLAQGGKCKTCNSLDPGGMGAFHIDHDHNCCPGKKCCGKCIRGLLCQLCNDLIGKAREKAETLRACADYVHTWDRAYVLTAESLQRAPYLRALHEKLLSLGGKAVVLWGGNNGPQTVQALVSTGVLGSVDCIIHKPMSPQNCHKNVTQLGEGYQILTGYALSAESIWYPHSWALDAEGRIVETTLIAKAYFGCAPTGAMAEDWQHQRHFVLTEDWQ
jgi:hypothetical protein